MIKVSSLIGNLFAVRRFLTYKFTEEKESMDKFAPSERNTTLNSNGLGLFSNALEEQNSNPEY
jgi:hypothetical protein